MTDQVSDLASLKEQLVGALELLRSHPVCHESPKDSGDTLPSLIERCRYLCASQSDSLDSSIRMVHHFACTGGTVLTKCLACQPNTFVLSEVDPLSTLHLGGKPSFSPTDLPRLLRLNPGVDESLVIEVFMAGLLALHERLTAEGRRLIVRDHPHSQYCTEQEAERPCLKDLIGDRVKVLSLVTVRHPLDSFLSLLHNQWLHFRPATLDEYSRRYLLFLRDHEDAPLYRYEDLLSSPTTVVAGMCRDLEIPFEPDFAQSLDLIRLTGDSGRSGVRLEPRERRDVPHEVETQTRSSSGYSALCEQLGYEQ